MSSPKEQSLLLLAFLGLLCLLGLIPITGESLWFDESTTAFLSAQTSWDNLWKELNAISFSETQMPGYVSYMWGWVQTWGGSEWTLRMANWPLFVGLLVSIYFLPFSIRTRWVLLALIGLSPFWWYNLNEARSTILLGSLAGIATHGVIYVFGDTSISQKRWGLVITSLSVMLGIACHMLFLLFLPALGLLAILLARQYEYSFLDVLKTWAIPLGAIGLVGILMLSYYFETLDRGAGGIYKTPGLTNLGFAFYEFLGFQGIGPSRADLKQLTGFKDLMPYVVGMLALGLVWGGMLVLAIQNLLKRRPNPYFWAMLGGLGIFLAIAIVKDFWFWGRHLIFLFPLLALALATWLEQSWTSHSLLARGVMIGGLALWGLSLVRLQTIDAYGKRDDYRQAVEMVIKQNDEGLPVFWTGNWMGGAYYGLDFKLGPDYLRKMSPTSWEAQLEAGRVPPFQQELMLELIDQYEGAFLIWFDFFNDRDRDGAMATIVRQRAAEVIAREKTFQLIRFHAPDSAELQNDAVANYN